MLMLAWAHSPLYGEDKPNQSADYPLKPVPFNKVEMKSDFWRPRLYDVEWSENLVDWNDLAAGVESAGEETSVDDADIPAEVTQRYYRIGPSGG